MALAVGVVATLAGCGRSEPKQPTIGFLVKMPEQAWFINEQNAAEAAGRELGFSVLRMGTPDGEKVMSAIDTLATQGAAGLVICPPDVRLGPAILARANALNLKVVTVDDQLVDASGAPIATVPHIGISAYKIGTLVGETLMAELHRRQWPLEQVGALRITHNELPTARARTDGATDALLKAGFPAAQIYDAPQRTTDTEGGFSAALPVLGQHGARYWLIYGMNEETVLGAVRATEQLKIDPQQVIGVGINGAGEAFAEFGKSQPTGFFGTIAISSTLHGRTAATNLFKWIAHGDRPPALIQTTGVLMLRDNWQQVRRDLGL